MTNDQAKTAFIEDLKAVLKKHNAEIMIDDYYDGFRVNQQIQAQINFNNEGFELTEFIVLGKYFDEDSEQKD